MADARTERQKVKEITDRLEEGLKELFESDKYKSYLSTMSKFHNYSANNIQLIAMQRPDATYVAGYKAWQRNFERHVNRGEKGIRILAPAPYKIKEEREKIDPVTNEPVLDRDGMPVVEEVEIKLPAFRVITVFDVAQTDGKELPGLGVDALQGNVENYQDFMEALERVSPVPIGYETMEGDRKGYFHDGQHRITIKEGMSEAQTAKTGVHEVAHAKLHAKEMEADLGLLEQKDRETKEVEAESIAYTVCQHFGIDTSDYSFGYIAGWSSGKELPELKSSLDTIRRTSSELIKGIEAQLLEIEKERVAEQVQEDIILLVANADRSEYDLLNVKGMERAEIFHLLSAMKDDDRQSVEAYLERAGAWVTLLANEQSREVKEYHLDYAYNTDTHEITDFKALQEEQEKANIPIEYGDMIVRISAPDSGEYETIKITNMQAEAEELLFDIPLQEENGRNGSVTDYLAEKGIEFVPIMRSGGLNDGYPQFYDFDVDLAAKEIHAAFNLPTMVQAEQLINRIEFHRAVFDSDERNLIMNHAYKLDNMADTASLAYSIAEQKDDIPLLLETKKAAQEEIDFLPDGMVGMSEMHEYGYLGDEMLPLTKDRASELFEEGLEVYLLHSDSSETLVEGWGALQGNDSLFGVEVDEWNYYLERELEEYLPGREMRLLYGNESRFGIYQLKDTEATRDIRFMAMDYLEEKGIPVSKENYELVYTGELKEGMSLEDIYTKFNIDRPADFTGHSLSVSDVVVLHQDGENTSHYVDSFGYREVPEFTKELAVSAEISVGNSAEKNAAMEETENNQEKTAEGKSQEEPDTDRVSYYVIEDLSTRVGSNPEKGEVEHFESLAEAIGRFKECREQEGEDKSGMAKAVFGFRINGREFDVIQVKDNQNCVALDFTQMEVEGSQFKEDFNTLYDEIGFDRAEVYREMLPEEKKDLVKELFELQLKTSGIGDVSLYMDRFDVLYEQGKMEHLMPTGEQNRMLENIPFTEWENPYIDTSSREADIDGKDTDLQGEPAEQVQEGKQTVVTLTVAECGEFHDFGEYHEGIAGVEEAIAIFNRIPLERMNGIPSIGINIHTEGTESYKDAQMDVVSGRTIDLEMLEYYPEITGNKKALAVISELMEKLPEMEVQGSLKRWMPADMQPRAAEPEADKAALLAVEIDQLSYDYDTYQYNDTVEDRDAQVANIAEDIRSGNTGYLNDFLNALVSDSIREGMTDIFGKGTALDDSEGIQNARKAKELLDRLAEYKPLAKIEELEECNYNMIDNVLNNEKPKEEKEKQAGRISIKEKLAEKKAVTRQRDRAAKEIPEKGAEKKSEREI